jgi:hypothetical protein
MRSSVFQFPLPKVVKCTKGALKHMGLRIISHDQLSGKIKASSGFSFLKPSLHVDLAIEELSDHQIKVTIQGVSVKKYFLQKQQDSETSEAEILERVSLLL